MKPFRTAVVLTGTILLSACAHFPGQDTPVDQLEPMPAAGDVSATSDGLANGMQEPAPLEPAVEAPADLWQRVRDGFALDLSLDNDRIRAQRDWYARHQNYLDRVASRAERYLHYIVEQAEARDMPMEMVLLPVVESAFDPFAYSHGRASGPWQFIPSTGRYFNLHQNWWYDGRRDIVASTDAALTYLQRLADRFDGDWLLALASYNAGAGTVSRAIARNKALGRPTDFWHLNLPRETRAYVPKLLAISQIVADPHAYNVSLKPISDAPYFRVVEAGSQLDLAEAARLAAISSEELYLLNPGYNQWATPPEGPHRILVPVDKADAFADKLAALPADARMRWQRYTIRSGDSLIRIANRFNITVGMIQRANNLRGNRIIAGQDLMIPTPARDGDAYALTADKRLAAKQDQGVSGRQRIDHQVRAGDTLWDIARLHKVSVRELARWNNMAPRDPLRVGQDLAVWTAEPTTVAAVARPEMIRKVNYAVRNGDSLYRIAGRFNVSVNDIARWNRIDTGKYLRPGQRLTLYVDVRNAF
jgi:membrane-bound lytic murein transglycosylase D